MPISPAQVAAAKNQSIPDEVTGVFDAMIVENWKGHTATVFQGEAADRCAVALGISREEVYKLGYLDIEDLYRAAGWRVEYDKPGYNETYAAHFTFSK